jgi:hypothetical protein
MSRADEAQSWQGADHLSQSSIEESFPVKVPVVRKLKPPPEIWELVQPVAPRATPGRALISRLPSSRSMFVVLVVLMLGVGAYIGVRSGKQFAGTRTAPPQAATKIDLRKAGVDVDKKSTQDSTPIVASSVDQTTAGAGSAVPKRKASQRRNSMAAVTVVSNPSNAGEKVSSPEGSAVSLPSVPKTRPSTNTVEAATTNSTDAASSRKSKTSLSPQLIDSPKTEAPRKSKVIQWP